MARWTPSSFPGKLGRAIPTSGRLPAGSDAPWYNLAAVMANVAASTARIWLETAVLLVGLRDPRLLAKQLATVDRLGGGRVLLGVSAGWLTEEFEAPKIHREAGTSADGRRRALHKKAVLEQPVGLRLRILHAGP